MMNLAEQSAVYRCDKNKGAVCHTDQSAVYRCSVHTHSTLCDGRDSPEHMAAAAFAAGVQFYGFSGHSHTISPFDAGCVLPVRPEEYCRRVLALRQQYHGQMQILLGIELDSLSDMSPDMFQPSPHDSPRNSTEDSPENSTEDSPRNSDVPWRFDYWIGSVHHLVTEQGEDFCVDYSREVFARGVKEIFHGDMYALWKGYYAEVGAMAERNPPVLGHMDLVTKFNENGAFFDETDRGYRGLALGALHRCDVEKTLLEVNTGAMSRGYRREPYPAAFLLEEWRKMGGRVIVTADAHSAETILYGYGTAVELLQATGYTESAILTLEGVKMVAL